MKQLFAMFLFLVCLGIGTVHSATGDTILAGSDVQIVAGSDVNTSVNTNDLIVTDQGNCFVCNTKAIGTALTGLDVLVQNAVPGSVGSVVVRSVKVFYFDWFDGG